MTRGEKRIPITCVPDCSYPIRGPLYTSDIPHRWPTVGPSGTLYQWPTAGPLLIYMYILVVCIISNITILLTKRSIYAYPLINMLNILVVIQFCHRLIWLQGLHTIPALSVQIQFFGSIWCPCVTVYSQVSLQIWNIETKIVTTAFTCTINKHCMANVVKFRKRRSVLLFKKVLSLFIMEPQIFLHI